MYRKNAVTGRPSSASIARLRRFESNLIAMRQQQQRLIQTIAMMHRRGEYGPAYQAAIRQKDYRERAIRAMYERCRRLGLIKLGLLS